MKNILRCALVILALLAAFCASAAAEGVVINEVMSRNTLYAPVNGEYAGWIEIYNGSDQAANITGWYLTDNVTFDDAFRFPYTVLAPKAAVLVYTGGGKANRYEPAYIAAFKVNKAGDPLVLTDAAGNPMDSVDVPALNVDEAYARDPQTGEWRETYEATPGMANERANYAQLHASALDLSSEVVISEAMASNKSYLAEAGCPDWIELCNLDENEIDLTGWHISDDPENPQSGTSLTGARIAPGGYLLLYADGENRVDENGIIHTGFSLSSGGECLVLSNASGRIASRLYFGELGRDVSCSRMTDGAFSTEVSPSPGWPNTEKGAQQARLSTSGSGALTTNDQGLYINEIMASTDKVNLDKRSYDWVEIYNQSGSTIDLSGYGLSDKESRPRKWQFPQGATIAPGGYAVVVLTGETNGAASGNIYRANFSLAATGGEVVTLARPDGTIIDRVGMGVQRANVSFGRPVSGDRFVYFAEATPGAPNAGASFTGVTSEVMFSTQGGVVKNGGFMLTLSSDAGARIYFTLDCTEPTSASQLYTGPIAITGTTIVRAIAVRDGAITSQIATQSYIFDEPTKLRVVSVVAAPDTLFGEKGVITNENKVRNVPASVEVYSKDGDQMLDQGCRMRLMGAGSLSQSQKSMKLIADAAYGDSLFRAKLFSKRDYTEYASFVLRSSGQDSWKTRMHDSILTSLLEGTPVLYQETETCVVYLNGQFYGHMNMRERLNAAMIAQYHGWEDPDALDVLENKGKTVQGAGRDDWFALDKWVYDNDMTLDSNVAIVEEQLDLENYLYYVAFQMYIANNDLGNVRWYRNKSADGKWRFAAYDVDLSWQTDQNSLERWLKSGGVGTITKQDNTMFRKLMQNEKVKDRFLTILGELMATNFSTANVQAKVMARYEEIHDDAVRTFEYFNEGDEAKWTKAVKRFYNYAATRPKKLLGYIQETTGYSEAQMRQYFGAVIDQISGAAAQPAAEEETYESEEQLIQENPRDEVEADAETEVENPVEEEEEPPEYVDLLG